VHHVALMLTPSCAAVLLLACADCVKPQLGGDLRLWQLFCGQDLGPWSLYQFQRREAVSVGWVLFSSSAGVHRECHDHSFAVEEG
jgi:hypothetical protein